MIKSYPLLLVFFILTYISNAQNVAIPDNNLKQALVNQLFPTIDVNNDGEIQVSEALNTTNVRLQDPTDSNGENDDDIIDFTGLEAFTNLETLIIYSHPVQSIDISIYPLLENLDLGQCNISSIDVSTNTNLKFLSLDDNTLNSIDVTQLTELESLDLRYNDNIQTIDVSNNLKLTKLALDINDLNVLDVTNNKDLIELTFPNNNITTIDLSQNSTLEKLSATNNNITEIDLTALDSLKNVNFTNNDLLTVDFSENLNLEFIYLQGNNSLSSMDITQNSKLEWLNLISTALETIDVSDKPLLRNLNIWGNPALISVNMKNGNNNNLTLGFTGIRDLPLLETICVDNIVYATNTYPVDGVDFTYINNCNANQYNTITGVVNYNIDNNACPNTNLLSNILVEVLSDSFYYSTLTDQNGNYTIQIPNTGDFSVTIGGELPSGFSIPDSQTSSFVGFNNSEIIDFCIDGVPIDDLSIQILPANEARPGFTAWHDIIYTNEGTSVINGEITLEFENNIQDIYDISPNYDTLETNIMTWNFSDLQPNEKRVIFADFDIYPPPTVNGDDILTYTVTITSNNTNESITDNNTNELKQIVVNSYDPNDKRVMQGSQISINDIDKYLDYIVRFQNTGTASAINVVVKDTLDPKLDWSTFKMISSSHDYEIEISNQNEIDFIFENINLPDSTSNNEGSNGYIAFKIKPKSDVVIGDVIKGKANIFFDFNLPIETNEVSTEVIDPTLSIDDNTLEKKFKIYPIPVTGNELFISKTTPIEILKYSFITINGTEIDVTPKASTNDKIILNTSCINSNLFFLKMVSNKGVIIKKVIK